MATNSVAITFTKIKITPDEFADLVYKIIPESQLTQFREDRYTIGLKTSVNPSPTISITDFGIKQVWSGVAVDQFSKEIFQGDNFTKIKKHLQSAGWSVSEPVIHLENVDPLGINTGIVYGNELFPAQPVDGKFCVTDSKDRFNKNKKKLGTDWYYYHAPVNYTVNSRNYRCPEFEDIDWQNSIILLGCSIAYGVGLDDNDCLAAMLYKELGIPVINLGIPGASTQFSLDTSVLVKKLYGNVKGIVFAWSMYSRSVLYKNPIEHIGAWNIEDYKLLTDYTHTMTTARLAYDTSKFVWEGTPRVDCSYFPDTAQLLGITQLPKIDLARDLSHPGIESTKASAVLIADMLAKQLPDR